MVSAALPWHRSPGWTPGERPATVRFTYVVHLHFTAETLFIAGTSFGSAIRNEESPFLETSRDGDIYRIISSVSDNAADNNERIYWIIMLTWT